MCLGLGHLNEYKLKHGFNDTISFICICEGDIESITDFFIHCPKYCEARKTFFDNIETIDKPLLLNKSESSLTCLVLYVYPKLNSNVNTFILISAIEFMLSSERFNRPLFNEAKDVSFHVFVIFSILSLIYFSYGFLKLFLILFCYLVLISLVFYTWLRWLLVLFFLAFS